MLDSGTTGHFFSLQANTKNHRPTSNPVNVRVPPPDQPPRRLHHLQRRLSLLRSSPRGSTRQPLPLERRPLRPVHRSGQRGRRVGVPGPGRPPFQFHLFPPDPSLRGPWTTPAALASTGTRGSARPTPPGRARASTNGGRGASGGRDAAAGRRPSALPRPLGRARPATRGGRGVAAERGLRLDRRRMWWPDRGSSGSARSANGERHGPLGWTRPT